MHALALTPDGTRIVSGHGDGMVRVWDLQSGTAVGEPLTCVQGAYSHVSSVAVTTDGAKIIASSNWGTVRIWDLHTRKLDRELLTGSTNRWVAATPDGARLVSVGGHEMQVWDLKTGTKTHELYFAGEAMAISMSGSCYHDGTCTVAVAGDWGTLTLLALTPG